MYDACSIKQSRLKEIQHIKIAPRLSIQSLVILLASENENRFGLQQTYELLLHKHRKREQKIPQIILVMCIIAGTVTMENNQCLLLILDSKLPLRKGFLLSCMWTVCKEAFAYCNIRLLPQAKIRSYHSNINSGKLKSIYSWLCWDMKLWKFKIRFPKYQNFSTINDRNITITCHALTKNVATGILEGLWKFSAASKLLWLISGGIQRLSS